MGGSASDDIQNDTSKTDLRWARYLQQCSITNIPQLHPNIDGNGNPSMHAGPSNHYGNQLHSSTNNYSVVSSASSGTFIMILGHQTYSCFSALPIELSTVLRSSPLAVDADSERLLTPTSSNVVQLREHIGHSPAHSNQVHSPATKRTPSNIPGVSAATEDVTSTTLWSQTCAAAAQWSALGIVEPNDQSGQSVLMEWVDRQADAFYCKVPTLNGRCRVYNSKKDRILSHVRKDHLNFRPFRCRGLCGTTHW